MDYEGHLLIHLPVVTILAFVFIPASLATSIFGMNLQELNHSGQPVWVFVVTTATIFVAAILLWGISYLWAQFADAPRVPPSRYEEKPWRTRISILLWLVSHSYCIWAIRSGIWFSLLTDGARAFKYECTCDNRFKSSMSHNRHAPCAYVETHRARGFLTAFSSVFGDYWSDYPTVKSLPPI